VRGQAGQGGHQPARPALDVAVLLEGHRASVGDQNERARVGQGPTLLREAP
jgi:hypothetical protein